MLNQHAKGWTGIQGRTAKRSGPTKSARSVTVRAASRELWLPGGEPPKHLDGSLAGDYGFDPLNLGSDPEALKWYVQAELVHCRFAMLGVVGVLVPELLTKLGVVNLPVWYEAGAMDISWTNFVTLVVVMHYMFGFAEMKRYMDFKNPGSQGAPGSFLGLEGAFKGGENGYPGGIFDPMGFSKGPEFEKMKLREVKNGRLAMMAMLGFFAQAASTGSSPLENLSAHLSDPWTANVASNSVALPFL